MQLSARTSPGNYYNAAGTLGESARFIPIWNFVRLTHFSIKKTGKSERWRPMAAALELTCGVAFSTLAPGCRAALIKE